MRWYCCSLTYARQYEGTHRYAPRLGIASARIHRARKIFAEYEGKNIFMIMDLRTACMSYDETLQAVRPHGRSRAADNLNKTNEVPETKLRDPTNRSQGNPRLCRIPLGRFERVEHPGGQR